eukprot:CAMPEP_0177156960 /NCGR_PEP_ID=MMETSP0367-20130122/3003_1 /TAXON_ID=447022 ORGANISM="Scrippsiella hangoei-like, Strain SHHI-4" /NCGR_SAMPLE_ID=MMETSP0367 /ASSEMBLY_ACC=CAM_ASM_000362 /LENGTH=500 /DNA_ID=CAMNT_0018602445 /DNA_START=174 /DNA_END=1677 /DNA_ORIENTATION=-
MYFGLNDHDTKLLFLPCNYRWKDLFKYVTIPLVSTIFTWWHVWLGIQMCFYPVQFVGCCEPYLGWQGIVPRRAHIMATRSCDIMIGTLITVEEIIERINEEDFFSSLEHPLTETSAAVIDNLARRHCPDLWARLPEVVKAELRTKVMEQSRVMFGPVIEDLKTNINRIIDIKQMAIDILVENKPLLVKMFLQIGQREFVFIQHVSAVMGFFLGALQMTFWIILNHGEEGHCQGAAGHSFRCWGGFVILPVSGLIIGYFTNWLGITMIFRPVEPKIVCGGYVNLQGVFLKRQQQVSAELAKMICTHLVRAGKMLEYVVKKDDVLNKVMTIYEGHIKEAVDKSLPGSFKVLAPRIYGDGTIDKFKKDIIDETLAELPKHSTEIENYMDRAFALQETLAYRLSRLHPARFEGMLHPVFQEDEWMVLLLGGVLGVLVGALQALPSAPERFCLVPPPAPWGRAAAAQGRHSDAGELGATGRRASRSERSWVDRARRDGPLPIPVV